MNQGQRRRQGKEDDMKFVHEVERLSAFWWIVLLRGLLALAFAGLIYPAAGAMRFDYGRILASLFVQASFGLYLLLASLLSIWLGVATLQRRHWPITIGHAALLVALAWWFITTKSSSIVPLAVLAAIHALSVGTTEITLAAHLRRHHLQSYALFAAGILSWCAAIAVVTLHERSVTVARLISAYAGLFGVALMAAAFQLRAIRRHVWRSTNAQA
jgi:uncharacterized membrane protein HdeD (DUF308 family)